MNGLVKRDPFIGKPDIIREDYSFVFNGYKVDDDGNLINESKALRRNRTNTKRYLKKKKVIHN